VTSYEALCKLRLAALDDELQARWRREQRVALAWSWLKGWAVPLGCVGMALYAVWEVLKP
jgi:hypothetical protein